MIHNQKYSRNKKTPLTLSWLQKYCFPTYAKREMAESGMKNLTKDFLKFGDVKIEKTVNVNDVGIR